MQRFQNILFVTTGTGGDDAALQAALHFSKASGAGLKALIVYPGLPANMADYKKSYEEAMVGQLIARIKQSPEFSADVDVSIEGGEAPATRIVAQVLRGQHDMVIKMAQPGEQAKGFAAIDMDLMRKCPCPVWLVRQGHASRQNPHIAVAIDPTDETQQGQEMAVKLLEVADNLALRDQGRLSVISCWDYPMEDALRHNVWVSVPEATLRKVLEEERVRHHSALSNVIAKAAMADGKKLHHIKGLPQQVIPQIVEKEGVDILVMGTVARTGIPGFFMGNTAEDVLQKVSCSLIAMKPEGFVSPVIV